MKILMYAQLHTAQSLSYLIRIFMGEKEHLKLSIF